MPEVPQKPWGERLLALADRFPTDDLRALLPRLHSYLRYGAEMAAFEKAHLAPILRGLIGEKLLREGWVTYNAARVDLEFPLLCGSRHTILIDPAYALNEVARVLAERYQWLLDVYGKGPQKIPQINFGSGPEPISFLPIAQRSQDFVPDVKVAAIVIYLPHPPMTWVSLPDQIAKLMIGGIIFSDLDSPLWWSSQKDSRNGLLKKILAEIPEDFYSEHVTEDTDPNSPFLRLREELLNRWGPLWDKNAKGFGLERIVVPNWHPVLPPLTFYRKVRESKHLIRFARATRVVCDKISRSEQKGSAR